MMVTCPILLRRVAWAWKVPGDRYSNLSQITVSQCSGTALSAPISSSTNQMTLIGSSTPTYDPNGNMTNDANYNYTFDAENRITQASGMSNGPYCYVYDGNGFRVEKFHANGGTCASPTNKVVDTLYWRAMGGGAIAETDGSGNTQDEYVFFAGQRIAQRDSSGNVNYYYTDQLGSTVAMTDGSGNACYQATFTPYGQEYATQTTCSSHYKFTGYERDAETGLDYAFARYYSSRLGRFMSPDPMGLGSADPADPQSLNSYAYVENNPETFIDPWGLARCVMPDGTVTNARNDRACKEQGGTWQPDQPLGGAWPLCTGTGPCIYGPVKPGGPGGGGSKRCPSAIRQLINASLIASNLDATSAALNALEWASLTGKAVVVGGTAGGAYGMWENLGAGGSVTVGIAADPSGNIGLAVTVKGGGGFAGPGLGYAAGGSITFSQSPTIFGLQGNSPQLGGAGGGLGMGGSVNVSISGSVTVTAGAASGAFGTFGGVSSTTVIPLICRSHHE